MMPAQQMPTEYLQQYPKMKLPLVYLASKEQLLRELLLPIQTTAVSSRHPTKGSSTGLNVSLQIIQTQVLRRRLINPHAISVPDKHKIQEEKQKPYKHVPGLIHLPVSSNPGQTRNTEDPPPSNGHRLHPEELKHSHKQDLPAAQRRDHKPPSHKGLLKIAHRRYHKELPSSPDPNRLLRKELRNGQHHRLLRKELRKADHRLHRKGLHKADRRQHHHEHL